MRGGGSDADFAVRGEILDWYKKDTGKDYKGADDPGVQSVTGVYNYYKKFGYTTQVMGASFRNTGEICELAGSDLLTISPDLLAELDAATGELPRKLDAAKAKGMEMEKIHVDKATFDKMHAEDRMANDKLKEGIRDSARRWKGWRRCWRSDWRRLRRRRRFREAITQEAARGRDSAGRMRNGRE